MRRGDGFVTEPLDATPWPNGNDIRPLEVEAGTLIVFDGLLAENFGAQLVRNRFGAQVTATRQRPDLVEIARRNPLLQRGPAAATAADIELKLRDGRIGVLTLTTFGGSGMAGANAGTTWWADGIHGFIAPADSAGTAANHGRRPPRPVHQRRRSAGRSGAQRRDSDDHSHADAAWLRAVPLRD